MKPRARTPIERKAYRVPEEAAEALGMGASHFKTYVLPDLKTVKRGKVRIVAAAELERWLDQNATDFY